MKIKSRFGRILAMIMSGSLVLISMAAVASATDSKPERETEYETGFYYTIKKGDTLWDISQRFNDTPWIWPDLWRENNQIHNPHWLKPGERIRLFLKKDKDRYSETPQVLPAPPQPVQVSAPVEPPPVITAPEVHFYYSKIDQVGFIRKPPVVPMGVLFKVLEDKKIISVDDVVYIKAPQNGAPASDLAPGSRWTVYRPMSPTDERRSEEKIGTQHYLLGILEVTRNEGNYAIAKVIKSFKAMRVGDLLMPYKARIPEVTVSASTPGLDGRLIIAEEHTHFIGEQVIAFIDKGEDDLVAAGQMYSIYNQETAKIGTKESALAPVEIGSLIVLHTERNNATVLITDARNQITAGTRFKTP